LQKKDVKVNISYEGYASFKNEKAAVFFAAAFSNV